jgi:hypothetical protein
LREWLRARQAPLTKHALTGVGLSAVAYTASGASSTSDSSDAKRTLFAPHEDNLGIPKLSIPTRSSFSAGELTIAPILALNTVIFLAWQFAEVRVKRDDPLLTAVAQRFTRGDKAMNFMQNHFTCSLWNIHNRRCADLFFPRGRA